MGFTFPGCLAEEAKKTETPKMEMMETKNLLMVNLSDIQIHLTKNMEYAWNLMV